MAQNERSAHLPVARILLLFPICSDSYLPLLADRRALRLGRSNSCCVAPYPPVGSAYCLLSTLQPETAAVVDTVVPDLSTASFEVEHSLFARPSYPVHV